MKVAVIGATGYVGGRLVPELLAAGHDVRCLARNPDRLAGVDWRSEVEVMTADVLDEDSLEAALIGVDSVYYLVHAMGHSGDFEQTDRIGAANTCRTAERAGLSRTVAMSFSGHKTESVYRRYAIVDEEAQQEGAAKLARLLEQEPEERRSYSINGTVTAQSAG